MIIKIRLKYILCIIALFIILLFILLTTSVCRAAVDSDTQEGDAVTVPILMYHEVKYCKLGKDVISPYEFENDLIYLTENHYNTVTISQLIDYVYQDVPLPESPIMITFDDGYLNTYYYAFPLLKKYNCKMVFSIIGKNSDDFTRIPDDNLDYSHVTWSQLKEMCDSGIIEVENHSYNLHSVGQGRVGCAQRSCESYEEYEQVLTSDIHLLQDKILSATGQTCNTFTYPYGKSSKNTLEIVKKCGFKATMSCTYGVNVITKDPEGLYDLKRICRSHNVSFQKLIAEAFKTVE